MRLVLALILATSSASAFADPRNTDEYQVLVELSAKGDSKIVNGFGAYIQVHEKGSEFTIRFCTNFEGKGFDGHPVFTRNRTRLQTLGGNDPTAYRCVDYTPAQVAGEVPLIKVGPKVLFAMKSENGSIQNGGELLLRFAKKVPLIGNPTFRVIRIRLTREAGKLAYRTEMLIPRGPVLPVSLLDFTTYVSFLGIPNGLRELTLNPGMKTSQEIDVDSLEEPEEN